MVYIEFAKNVANDYRILLKLFFLLNIFPYNFYSCLAVYGANANKKWSEQINIEEWGWKPVEKGIEPTWITLSETP